LLRDLLPGPKVIRYDYPPVRWRVEVGVRARRRAHCGWQVEWMRANDEGILMPPLDVGASKERVDALLITPPIPSSKVSAIKMLHAAHHAVPLIDALREVRIGGRA